MQKTCANRMSNNVSEGKRANNRVNLSSDEQKISRVCTKINHPWVGGKKKEQ